MKYRFIVPGLFLVLMVLFFAFFIEGAGGHGWNPFDYVVYLLFPASFLMIPLRALGAPPIVWFAACILGSGAEYFLIGYGIDKLLARRRRIKALKNSD